jgi:hypothetical protein
MFPVSSPLQDSKKVYTAVESQYKLMPKTQSEMAIPNVESPSVKIQLPIKIRIPKPVYNCNVFLTTATSLVYDLIRSNLTDF